MTVPGPANAVIGHGLTLHFSHTDACPFVEVYTLIIVQVVYMVAIYCICRYSVNGTGIAIFSVLSEGQL